MNDAADPYRRSPSPRCCFDLLTVLGPTASGKTSLAVALCRELGGEIVSADSRQVFRGMDLGTGKDLHEYGGIRYHLIDLLPPGDEFSLFSFQKHFIAAYSDIRGRGLLPVLCGGTGLYLDAVLRGYRLLEVPPDPGLRDELAGAGDAELAALLCSLRPEQHNTSDLAERERTIRAIEIARYERAHPGEHTPWPAVTPLVIGIRWERSELRRRITERLRQRLDAGMVEEVQRLHAGGVPWERLDYYGLEYRFAGYLLRGELGGTEFFQRLNSAIHDFAKRQETWFRRMERHGVVIHWVDGGGDPFGETMAIVSRRQKKCPSWL